MRVLRAKGFVGGVRSGRLAHSILQNKEELLEEWLKVYKFELNEAHLYYSTREDILPRLKEYFAGKNEQSKYGRRSMLHPLSTPSSSSAYQLFYHIVFDFSAGASDIQKNLYEAGASTRPRVDG